MQGKMKGKKEEWMESRGVGTKGWTKKYGVGAGICLQEVYRFLDTTPYVATCVIFH